MYDKLTVFGLQVRRSQRKVTAFSGYSAKSQCSAVTVQSHSVQWLQCKITAFSGYSAKSQHSAVTMQSHSIWRLQCKVTAFGGYSAKSQHSAVTVQSHSIQQLQCKVTAFSGYSAKSQHSAVIPWQTVMYTYITGYKNTRNFNRNIGRPDQPQQTSYCKLHGCEEHLQWNMATFLKRWPIRSHKTILHYCNITCTNIPQYCSIILQKSI